MTPYQKKKCNEFFEALKEEDYIYPGHLKSKLVIDIKVAYIILEELKKRGFLTTIFEVYCRNCSKSKGIFLESLEQFNPNLYCDFCDKQLTIDNDIIVLYKVVHL